MPRVILPPSCDGLVQVHQLLCGRDIAVDLSRNPMFGVAAQMANFVYLVADGASGSSAVVLWAVVLYSRQDRAFLRFVVPHWVEPSLGITCITSGAARHVSAGVGLEKRRPCR